MSKISNFFCACIDQNPGSFGCLPHPVLLAYNELFLELESMPDLFIRQKMRQHVTENRKLLAGITGAAIDDCVLIPNVAHGVNTVLRNFPWQDNDKIIIGLQSF